MGEVVPAQDHAEITAVTAATVVFNIVTLMVNAPQKTPVLATGNGLAATSA